jgi:hypothetical protein
MDSAATDPEILRLQLNRSLDLYQFYTTLLFQGIGFLVGADVILLGYGLTQRKAALLLIAAFMPLVMLVLRLEIGKNSLAIAYVALCYEDELSPGAHTLTRTLLATVYSAQYRLLEVILRETDPAQRLVRLRAAMSWRHAWKDGDVAFFGAGVVAQAGVFALGSALGMPFL